MRTTRIDVNEAHVVEVRSEGRLGRERVVVRRMKVLVSCRVVDPTHGPGAAVAPPGDL
jgi:hypothetical protein